MPKRPPKLQFKTAKRNKFGAIRTTVDGITFDSKHESIRYQSLKVLRALGKIKDIELQPTYPIVINGIPICKVKLDFRYFDKDIKDIVIEDAKGKDLPMSRLKRKLVEAMYGIKVNLV